MAILLRLVLCLLVLVPPTAARTETRTETRTESRAIIVLDASGSMWDELDGRPKRDIVQQALEAVLHAVPADAELGLLAYGHREKGNCDDIELVVPPARGAATTIASTAANLNSTGKTPLTAAVALAAQALDSPNQPATVILITDGVDNCAGDPCALATMLEQTGAAFTTHVVGFGLNADEAAAVSCLARETGGSYLQANDLAMLTRALQDTVRLSSVEHGPASPARPPEVQPEPEPLPAPAPAPLPAPVEPAPIETMPVPDAVTPVPNFAPTVLLSSLGPALDANAPMTFRLLKPGQIGADDAMIVTAASVIPQGNYILETRIGAVIVTQPLTVDDSPAAPQVILNAAEVTLAPRIGPGAAIEPTTEITISGALGDSMTLTTPFKTWLAAGDYTLTARLDTVTNVQDFRVDAGPPVQQDIVISAAPVVPQVHYAPGQPVSAPELRVDIVRAATNPDGSRSVISGRTGAAPVFHLGAGDYIAIAQLGLASVEAPFSIALVQRTELPITLNAGVIAIAATGASNITITTPPDIAGTATTLGSVATDSWQETLNSGSYVVTATFGDAIASAPVVIAPGGRVDLVLKAP